MQERAAGIILRTRRLTETSLIVHWLTPEWGRIATVAKGALRPQSPFRGKLDLFYSAEFSFARSRRSDLHTLREVRLRETRPALREDLERLQQVAYCAGLIEQTTETGTPLPEIAALLAGLVDHVVAHTATPLPIFAFELKLLQELGLAPDVREVRLTPGARQLLARAVELDWAGIGTLKSSAEQAREIRQFLHGYLIYHLGRMPSGRRAALGGTDPAE